MNIIDLRSDTVSHPTPEMREAMANAELGDDVYGEDPTVNRLQEMAAHQMGKEAGLFVASGTMGNLIAVLAHCQRGDEAIMGTMAHTFTYEQGGVSALGGVFPHTVPNQMDGTLKLEDIEAAIRGEDVHFPISRLILLENTQNRCGGVVLTPEYTRQVADLASKHHLMLHLDGARIFNAAAALNVDVKELSVPADSITFCLSKGCVHRLVRYYADRRILSIGRDVCVNNWAAGCGKPAYLRLPVSSGWKKCPNVSEKIICGPNTLPKDWQISPDLILILGCHPAIWYSFPWDPPSKLLQKKLPMNFHRVESRWG